jgi:hypothetical protein
MRRPAAALALACAACSHGAPQTAPEPAGADTTVRRYDLVPRGYDPNGFILDPEFGWWFNRRLRCRGADQDPDPSTCSWRFVEEPRASGGPLACNTRLLDPDLSDHWSTWLVGITCSDSPLLYTGHLNWGDAYRGAVTYRGTLSWQEYATNDHDLNFYFEPDEGPSPGFNIGVEIDRRDVIGFHSPWFVGLNESLLIEGKNASAAWVGRRKAVITGLLGIDAEHLSARSLNVELHPVFGMAVQTATSARNEVWTVFARDGGNEGFCSHQDREHVLNWPGNQYRVELPLDCRPREAVVTKPLCGDRAGATSSVMIDRKRAVALVTIGVPEGGTVEGEIRIHCSGRHKRAAPSDGKPPPGVPVPLDRRSLGTAEEGEDLQQKLARICAGNRQGCEEVVRSVIGNGACVEVPIAASLGDVPAPARPPASCATGLPAPFSPPSEQVTRLAAPRSATSTARPAPPEAARPTERKASAKKSVAAQICAKQGDPTASRLCAVLQQGR